MTYGREGITNSRVPSFLPARPRFGKLLRVDGASQSSRIKRAAFSGVFSKRKLAIFSKSSAAAEAQRRRIRRVAVFSRLVFPCERRLLHVRALRHDPLAPDLFQLGGCTTRR